jgi:hypothetical protein
MIDNEKGGEELKGQVEKLSKVTMEKFTEAYKKAASKNTSE